MPGTGIQQKTFFRGPMLVELDPPSVEAADVLVADGRIARKGWRLHPPRDAEIVDARGRILCPGLVNAHVRMAPAFARTMPVAADSGSDVAKIQGAETEESLIAGTFAAAVEAARAGTTSVLALHESRGFVRGSLARMRDVLSTIGLRASVACGLTGDLSGDALESALLESRDAAAFGCGGRTAFLLGAGDVSALTDATLQALAETGRRHETPVHAVVGRSGEADADVARLRSAGLLRPNSVVLLLGALSSEEVHRLAGERVVLVRSPSGELSAVKPVAPRGEVAASGALGTDGARPDLFEEMRLAFARARAAGEAATPEDFVAMLARGQRLASEIFKTRLGSFQPGSAGDLLVLDYRPATPLNAATVCHHVLFGMSAAFVQSVMVDGHFVVRDRTVTNVDVRNLFRQTQRGALDLWQRAFGTELPGLGVSLRTAATQEGAPREDGREPARRSEDDLEFEPLVHASDPGRPWFVCQQPDSDPAPDADADVPAAAPIPTSARKETPAPSMPTPAPKDRAGGFGAGII
jgi:5-methylthioadenosine/S-adenosylhomocysteine deaminase